MYHVTHYGIGYTSLGLPATASYIKYIITKTVNGIDREICGQESSHFNGWAWLQNFNEIHT